MPDPVHGSDANAEATNSCPSKSELLASLDIEIATIEASRSKAGWNLWALLAALASIFWMLLSDIEDHGFDMINVVYCLICTLLFIDIFTFLFLGTNSRIERKEADARFRPMRFFSHRRLFFSFSLIRMTLLYLSAAFLGYTTHTSIPISFHAYTIGMGIVFAAFLAITTRDDISMQTESTQKATPNAGIYNLIFLSIPIASFLEYTNLQFPFNLNISNFKQAILIGAIIDISRLLVSHHQTPPLYYSLFSIRRHLLLGNISEQHARKQMEIAIDGLRFTEVFQSDISSMLSNIQECRNEVRDNRVKAMDLLKRSKEIETRFTFENENEDQAFHTAIIALNKEGGLKEMIQSSEKISRLLNQHRESFSKFSIKLRLLVTWDRGIEKEADKLLDQISDSLSTLTSENMELGLVIRQLDLSTSSLDLISQRILKKN